jgi:tRNA(Ile)-lysidine synthase
MQLNLEHLPRTRRYLIGVSGGRDSVALLHALHERGYRKLVVCHVNHRLRGRASTADAIFVNRLALRLGYTCETLVTDVAELARSSKRSIETSAREARHDFFAAMARKHRCPRVFLAHHAEDQAETVLMRILRGTGLSGLGGMKASVILQVGKTALTLLRPLLHIRRADIDAFIAAHGIRYREDTSNQDTVFTRNQVRHQLLPQLSAATGREVTPMFLRLAAQAQRDDDFLTHITNTFLLDQSPIASDGSLRITAALKALHPAMQHRVVQRWLQSRCIAGLDHDTICACVTLFTQRDPARINLSQGLQVRRKSGRLSIASQQRPPPP